MLLPLILPLFSSPFLFYPKRLPPFYVLLVVLLIRLVCSLSVVSLGLWSQCLLLPVSIPTPDCWGSLM